LIDMFMSRQIQVPSHRLPTASGKVSPTVRPLCTLVILVTIVAHPVAAQVCVQHEVQKIIASDAYYGDRFGYAVSIFGDRIVVGASEDNDVGSDSGSAYVLKRDDNGTPGNFADDVWIEEAKLTASDGAYQDWLGSSVSISEQRVLVGAYGNNDAGSDSGSAYVFLRDDVSTPPGAINPLWIEEAKLTASDAAGGDRFGVSVSISDEWAVVGASGDDDGGSGSGSAYVFRCDDNGTPDDPNDDLWSQVAKLTASDAAASDLFGASVSIVDDRILVGSYRDDDGGANSGSAYVFRRDDAGTLANPSDDTWIQEAKLVASDPTVEAAFGFSVCISSQWAVVGAPLGYYAAAAPGSAYAFRRDDNGTPSDVTDDFWSQAARLTAIDGSADDRFGNSVSLAGDRVLVGAYQGDGSRIRSGSAYVFRRDDRGTPSDSGDDIWIHHAKLTASDGETWDWFGRSAAMSGECAVVGAHDDDDDGESTGAAYVFTLEDDCNGNGIHDREDILDGTSPDCNDNCIPDECDLTYHRSGDCNATNNPDECDIASGVSEDCTVNSIPDECEPDCNANTVADSCDIRDAVSEDCNCDGVPDECDPPVDCPVCCFEDAAHCQRLSGEYIYSDDRAHGLRLADDFRAPAGGGVINRVCYFHAYVPPQGGECADDPPDDDLVIRFYEDAFGLPGTELPNSPGDSVAWDARETQPGFRTWRYSAPIDPGVQVENEACYWIETSGFGRPDCEVHWTESRDGNRYHVEDDSRLIGAAGWGYEDLTDSDLAFCIDIGITPATTPWKDGGCGDIEVACCRYDWSCNEENLSTCLDDWAFFLPIGAGYPLETCADVTCPVPPNDECENAEPICRNVCTYPVPNEDCTGAGDPAGCCTGVGTGTCNLLSSRWTCNTDDDCPGPDQCLDWAPNPDNGYCANDDLLDDGPVCSRSAQDCYDGSSCRPYADGDIYRCYANTDNRFASTDGPYAGGDCHASGENSFQADVWHEIIAPCTGFLVIDECTSLLHYDAMLGVFGDDTTEYADTACPINTNDDLLKCNDDFCPGSLSGLQVDVVKDGVYLLRSGGWSSWGTQATASQGRATMNIGVVCPPVPPVVSPGLPDDPTHQARKNRYISLDLSTNGNNTVAYEVTVSEMNRCMGDSRRSCDPAAPAGDDDACPNVCAENHDLQCLNDTMCGGLAPCVPGGPCVPLPDVGTVVGYIGAPGADAAGVCFPNDDCGGQHFANVVSDPAYRVWTEDVVHVTGCEIVPAVVYEVRGVEQTDGIRSDPLTIRTISKPRGVHYGDVAGPVIGGLFSPPDGFVSVIDVQAYVIANQGGIGATAPAHTTWVDLHGVSAEQCTGDACTIPQGILSVSDLGRIKFGFIGQTYVETPGHEDPGDCPP